MPAQSALSARAVPPGPIAARLADPAAARLPDPRAGAARLDRCHPGVRRRARRPQLLHAPQPRARPARRRRLVRFARCRASIRPRATSSIGPGRSTRCCSPAPGCSSRSSAFVQALHAVGRPDQPGRRSALCLIALGWATAPVLDRDARLFACLALLMQPTVIAYSSLGRADHHSLLLLLFILFVGQILRLLDGAARASSGDRRRRGRGARGLDQPGGARRSSRRVWPRLVSAGCSARAASRATIAISSPPPPLASRWR